MDAWNNGILLRLHFSFGFMHCRTCPQRSFWNNRFSTTFNDIQVQFNCIFIYHLCYPFRSISLHISSKKCKHTLKQVLVNFVSFLLWHQHLGRLVMICCFLGFSCASSTPFQITCIQRRIPLIPILFWKTQASNSETILRRNLKIVKRAYTPTHARCADVLCLDFIRRRSKKWQNKSANSKNYMSLK